MFFFPKIIAYFLAEKTHWTGFDIVSISSCEILMLIYMYTQTVSFESSLMFDTGHQANFKTSGIMVIGGDSPILSN